MASSAGKYKFASIGDYAPQGRPGSRPAGARPTAQSAVHRGLTQPKKTILEASDDDDDTTTDDDNSDSDNESAEKDAWIKKLSDPSSTRKSTNSTPFKTNQPRSKTEEIADSDVERKSAKAIKAEKTVKLPSVTAKSSTTNSTSSSTSDSDSDSDSDSLSSGAKKNGSTRNMASPKRAEPEKAVKNTTSSDAFSTSSEESSDSSSESDSEDESSGSLKKPAVAKPLVNGNGRSANTTTSESVSDSSSSEESDSESTGDKHVSAPSNKSDESSSGGSSSADSESEAEDSDQEMADESLAITHGHDNNNHNIPEFIRKDFVVRQAGREDVKEIAQMFSEARLAGKQIWYFTVPESVPVNVVEKMTIPMDKINSDEPILSHDGKDYAVSDNSLLKDSLSLLVNYNGREYTQVPHVVDKVLHLKRITQLPPIGGQMTEITIQTRRAPRPQPEGLRQRFRPIGVPYNPVRRIATSDSSEESDEDVRMQNSPSSAQQPAASPRKTNTKLLDALNGHEESGISFPNPKKDSRSKIEKRKHKPDIETVIPASTYEVEDEIATNSGGGGEVTSSKKARKHKKHQDKIEKHKQKPNLETVPMPTTEYGSPVKAELGDDEQKRTPKKLMKSEKDKKRKRRGSDANSASSNAVETDSQSSLPTLPNLLQMTDSPAKMKSKRKHSSEEDAEAAAAQLAKENLWAERKVKKARFAEAPSPELSVSAPPAPAKRETPIPVPNFGKMTSSLSRTALSSSPAQAPTPLLAKSSGVPSRVKERTPEHSAVKYTPVVPPFVPHVSPGGLRVSSATGRDSADLSDDAAAKAKKERKERKREKKNRERAKESLMQPPSSTLSSPHVKVVTPVPVPKPKGMK